MLFDHADYRSYLRDAFMARRTRNSSISLRVIADKLQVSQPFLTAVLKGRKNLSQETAHRVAKYLGLKSSEAEYFCLLVQAEASRDPDVLQSVELRLRSLNPRRAGADLSLDTFKAVSEWHHFALCSLLEVPGVGSDPRAWASRLGIGALELTSALERLLKLGLIEAHPGSESGYRRTNHFIAASDMPNQALRDFHRQTLARATESLESQSNSEKFVGSETFAFSPRALDEARAVLEEAFSRVVALADREAATATEVYHLGIQLFRLTRLQPAKHRLPRSPS